MMNKLVVCDAGPLIALAKINQLSLLRQLFNEVIVPETVLKECLINISLPGAQKIKEALDQKIILPKKASIMNFSLDKMSILDLLDDGEKEAIIIAKEFQAELLIDEKQGRKVAKSLFLKVIGIAGLLLMGHEKGFVVNIENCLYQLKIKGYRLSDRLIEEVLWRVKNQNLL